MTGAPTVNPEATGTKAAWCPLSVPSGGKAQLRLRLHETAAPTAPDTTARQAWHGGDFEATVAGRRREADELHASLLPVRTGGR